MGFNSKFQPGFFGNYFTKMMQPDASNKVKNKMKAAKSLLDTARNTDMAEIKVPISISRLIKLTLGDTFRFVIAHQLRHFIQIKEVLEVLQINKQSIS